MVDHGSWSHGPDPKIGLEPGTAIKSIARDASPPGKVLYADYYVKKETSVLRQRVSGWCGQYKAWFQNRCQGLVGGDPCHTHGVIHCKVKIIRTLLGQAWIQDGR